MLLVNDLKTSEEWQKFDPEIKVLDPDGWNRSNYQYSWYEEQITYLEYLKRRSISTVMWNKNNKKQE